MLSSLYISNFVLISELNISFKQGFSVITGETGAGKSIILGALGLILGQRADIRSIKSGADKCVIEAEFDISGYLFLDNFFADNDLDKPDNICTIRRELTNSGKSRAFVNDSPVSLNVIRELTSQLIDIHSQHENLLLSNDNFQLDVIDTIAANQNQLTSYRQSYQQWKNLQSGIKHLREASDRQKDDLDYLRFQLQQLTDARLKESEMGELEAEQETLSHAEEIKLELNKALVLFNDDASILPLLKEGISTLSKIGGFIAGGNEWLERLNAVQVEMKDIVSELAAIEDKVEFNPERLEWIDNRMSELYGLLKKFHVASIEELIQIRNDYSLRLQKIESYDEEIELLERQLAESESHLKQEANLLKQSRQNSALPIEEHVMNLLSRLGMPYIQFKVDISDSVEYTENGRDNVQFYFSANKNQPMQPVAMVASGGEVSRLMLAVKSLIAHKSGLPTVIFDEIDTGVSGEIAHRMGEIMQQMAQGMQVITITHLPQIAAKGKEHYRVYKDNSGELTETHIRQLEKQERITEIAQMLSGNTITDSALKNASDLLTAG